MRDWRQIENALDEFFRSRGYRIERRLGIYAQFCGDLIVPHENKPINLSDLARELAQDARP